MTKINQKYTNSGILLALVAAIISGIAIFYSKISLVKIEPLVLTTSRNFYVAILFFLVVLLSGKIKEIQTLKKGQWLKLILIGLIGGGIPFYLFFTGLKLINPQTANMIHKSLFIWVGILAFIFLKEKFNWKYIISYLLLIASNFIFIPAHFVLGNGELMIITATLLWSIESIIAKRTLKDVSFEILGLFRMIIGSSVLILTLVLSNKLKLSANLDASKLGVIFIGGTILFFYVYFWFKALKFAPAGVVTLILTFSIVVGNFLNGSFANVRLTQKDIMTSFLVLSGVLIIYLKPIIDLINNKLYLKKNAK